MLVSLFVHLLSPSLFISLSLSLCLPVCLFVCIPPISLLHLSFVPLHCPVQLSEENHTSQLEYRGFLFQSVAMYSTAVGDLEHVAGMCIHCVYICMCIYVCIYVCVLCVCMCVCIMYALTI